jgi:hypothetical protein
VSSRRRELGGSPSHANRASNGAAHPHIVFRLSSAEALVLDMCNTRIEKQDLRERIAELERSNASLTNENASLTGLLQQREGELRSLKLKCWDYRGQWMNTHKENEILRQSVPEDALGFGMSQARPWASSPSRVCKYFPPRG